MPTASAPGGRLSLIVFSGAYDKVHYALGLASAALATGRPVTLFFTMGALAALTKQDENGVPGWARLGPAETSVMGGRDGSGAPALAAPDAATRDTAFAEAGIATMEELLTACAELGADFMVCAMGMRAAGLTPGDLRADLPVTEGGMASFLTTLSGDGAALFI